MNLTFDQIRKCSVWTTRSGIVFIASPEDDEMIGSHGWTLDSIGYICASIGGKVRRLHRLVANAPAGLWVDHANLDKKDNRRENLRICTREQNYWNRPPQKRNALGLKGIRWSEQRRRYEVEVRANNVRYRLGRFEHLEDAIRAHTDAVTRLHGEFARHA